MTTYEQLRTLANPVRIDILQTLKSKGDMQASEIIENMENQLTVPQLSQHLSKLRLTKLILATPHKGRPQYRVNQPALNSVLSRLEALGE